MLEMQGLPPTPSLTTLKIMPPLKGVCTGKGLVGQSGTIFHVLKL